MQVRRVDGDGGTGTGDGDDDDLTTGCVEVDCDDTQSTDESGLIGSTTFMVVVAISGVTAVAAITLGVYLYNRYVAQANTQSSQDEASGQAVPTEAAMPVGIEMNAVGIQMKDDSQETPKSPKSPKTLKKKKAKKPT